MFIYPGCFCEVWGLYIFVLASQINGRAYPFECIVLWGIEFACGYFFSVTAFECLGWILGRAFYLDAFFGRGFNGVCFLDGADTIGCKKPVDLCNLVSNFFDLY